MTLIDCAFALPFALLALAALPLAGPRRAVLVVLYRGGQLATLAGVAACGLFAYRTDLAPEALRHLLAGTAPTSYPEVAWLVKAALLLLVALPLLAHLEYARELAPHASFVRELRQTMRALTAPGGPIEEGPRPPLGEAAAAVEAMRASAGTARTSAPTPRKLVKDLLEQPR